MLQGGQLYQIVVLGILRPYAMQQSRSYISDSSDFIKKLREIKEISTDVVMGTVDVVGLYSSAPHDVGLEALRRTLDDRVTKKIDTEDPIKMAEFVLKNSYFEFNGKVKQQLSGTAIGTNFTPPYDSWSRKT